MRFASASFCRRSWSWWCDSVQGDLPRNTYASSAAFAMPPQNPNLPKPERMLRTARSSSHTHEAWRRSG